QDRNYRPLGSTKSKTADVRIIAATNTDLQRQIQTQRFREDLYYRLNIISLRLPPLRERTGDVPLLATHFLRRYGHHYGREALRFSADTLQKLEAYLWPGNVRELETVIQRAVILGASPVLQPEDIDLSCSYPSTIPQTGSFREAKAQSIEQFERTYLSTLLATYQGNISQAAKHAGKERRAFTRLLEKYALHKPRSICPEVLAAGHTAILAALNLMGC